MEEIEESMDLLMGMDPETARMVDEFIGEERKRMGGEMFEELRRVVEGKMDSVVGEKGD